MSDLVERDSRNHMSQHDVSTLLRRFHEAAAEITRLRAVNAELVEALEGITELLVDTWVYDMSAHGAPDDEMAIKRARTALTAALEGKK